MAEYTMAFHNLEGVKSVQEARTSQAYVNSDDQLDVFLKQVEDLFGKPIDKESLK